MANLYAQPSAIGAGMLGEEKESPLDALARLASAGKTRRIELVGDLPGRERVSATAADPGQPVNFPGDRQPGLGQGFQDFADNYNTYRNFQGGETGGGIQASYQGGSGPAQGSFRGAQEAGMGSQPAGGQTSWWDSLFGGGETAGGGSSVGPGLLGGAYAGGGPAIGAGGGSSGGLLGVGTTGSPFAGAGSGAGAGGAGAGGAQGGAAGIGALGAAAWLAAPIALVMGLRMKRSADRKEEAKREEAWASTLTPEARAKHYSPEERARRSREDEAHRKKVADENALAELLYQGE